MALFKPNGATTTGTSFKGICECNIINIEDKSDLSSIAIILQLQIPL